MQVNIHPALAINVTDPSRLVPVHSDRDLEQLIKESEVLTGKPGREFVIVGAERLSYHVEWTMAGLNVRRLLPADAITPARFVRTAEVKDHILGDALACGQLFTLSVH